MSADKTNVSKYSGLSNDEIEEIKEAFNLFDTDGTGLIDPKELRAAMLSLGFEYKNPVVFKMISDLDKENSSAIDFPEFLTAITSKLVFKYTNQI